MASSAPPTFAAPSDVTGTHGRYVRLETEDDATAETKRGEMIVCI